jgi:acetylornithine deacetylase
VGPRDQAEAGGRGLSPVERRAVEALDVDALVRLLCRLIALPSLDGAETPAQEAVAGWLDDAGLCPDVWPIDLDDLRRHPHFSAEVERTEALGVVGRLEGSGGGRDLLLDGHIDVVPVGDEQAWTVPPWRGTVREGLVYGRGAVDMKGGLCCALAAAKALRDAGVRLRGRLLVASVVGEEDGGAGTLATLLRGHHADGAIITEPTALGVVTAQAGSYMFRLTVDGRAAHGSVREEGVSAIEKFWPIFDALRRLETERNAAGGGELYARYRLPWPIEVGTMHAGEWASSVPGRLVCEGRCGIAVGEEPAAAQRALEDAVARAAAADLWLRDHPPRVEWWGGRFDPAVTDPADPVVTVLSDALRSVTGASPALEGVTYGSDLRLLVNVGGIPTVLFGPGDVRAAHMADEHVPLDELRVAAESLVVAAARFCGAD